VITAFIYHAFGGSGGGGRVCPQAGAALANDLIEFYDKEPPLRSVSFVLSFASMFSRLSNSPLAAAAGGRPAALVRSRRAPWNAQDGGPPPAAADAAAGAGGVHQWELDGDLPAEPGGPRRAAGFDDLGLSHSVGCDAAAAAAGRPGPGAVARLRRELQRTELAAGVAGPAPGAGRGAAAAAAAGTGAAALARAPSPALGGGGGGRRPPLGGVRC
jgi:hypothetical protein